jgi:hypothetical protein
MDDEKRARLSLLLKRQARASRVPGILEAWRSCGVPATALNHERAEQLIDWVKANWRRPDQRVADSTEYIKQLAASLDVVLFLDFWQWDEAVGVLVPARSALRVSHRLRDIYPDGFLAADQGMSRALVVDFDDHVDGAEIAWITAD